MARLRMDSDQDSAVPASFGRGISSHFRTSGPPHLRNPIAFIVSLETSLICGFVGTVLARGDA
jgi:hypothetical protein